jgi:hypothetical protein
MPREQIEGRVKRLPSKIDVTFPIEIIIACTRTSTQSSHKHREELFFGGFSGHFFNELFYAFSLAVNYQTSILLRVNGEILALCNL